MPTADAGWNRKHTMMLKTEKSPSIEASRAESLSRSKLASGKKAASRSEKQANTAGLLNTLIESNKENGLSSKQKFSSSKSYTFGEFHEDEMDENESDKDHDISSKISRPKKSKSTDDIAGSSKHSVSKAKSRHRSKSPSSSKVRNRHRSVSPTYADGPSRTGRSPSKARSRKRDKSVTSSRSRSLSVSAPKKPSGHLSATSITNGSDDLGKSGSKHKKSNWGDEMGKNGSKHRKSKRRFKRVEATDSASSLDEISLTTSLSVRDDIKTRALNVHHASLNALVYKLKDTSLEEELVSLFNRIEKADGVATQRPTPIDANQITVNMLKVVQNDPEVTTITIQDDRKFQNVDKRVPVEFAEGLSLNLHLTSLILTGVGLEDDFLIAISSSIRDNFTLENLELADNCFTSRGLLEFCCCLGVNIALRTVDIRNQANSVVLLKEHERGSMEAIINNKYVQLLEIDVTTEKCKGLIELTVERNIKSPKYLNYDKRLLKHCQDEARNAEQLFQLNLIEERLKHQFKKEMSLLSNLADIASINKPVITSENEYLKSERSDRRQPQLAEEYMTDDGAFLDEDFISKFIEEDPSSLGVIFNFTGQSALFKKFDRAHEARKTIVTNLIDALAGYSQAPEITRVIMRDSCCQDDFVIALCQKCQGHSKILPKLFLLDLGMNCITDAGISALSACITDKKSLRYLQVLIIEDQYTVIHGKKIFFSWESELILTKALCQNLSILRLSLKMRNLSARRKVNGYLARNLDLLEQARIMKELSGKIKHARNELEQQIDRLAANDPAVWHLDCSADQRFLSLKRKDVLKVAKALSDNKFVTEVRLEKLELDDEFADHLSESIESNHAIRTLSLEGNAISGQGIKSIIVGLAKNRTIVDVRLRHQAQPMSSDDEREIIALLGDNHVLLKLGLDIESEEVRASLAKRLMSNQQSQWKTQRRSLPSEPDSPRTGVMVQRKSMD